MWRTDYSIPIANLWWCISLLPHPPNAWPCEGKWYNRYRTKICLKFWNVGRLRVTLTFPSCAGRVPEAGLPLSRCIMLHHNYPHCNHKRTPLNFPVHQETSLSLGLSDEASSVFAFFSSAASSCRSCRGFLTFGVIVNLLHHAELILAERPPLLWINKTLDTMMAMVSTFFQTKHDSKQCCPHWCSSAYLARLGLGSRHELCQCTCPGTPMTPEMVEGLSLPQNSHRVRSSSFEEIVSTF